MWQSHRYEHQRYHQSHHSVEIIHCSSFPPSLSAIHILRHDCNGWNFYAASSTSASFLPTYLISWNVSPLHLQEHTRHDKNLSIAHLQLSDLLDKSIWYGLPKKNFSGLDFSTLRQAKSIQSTSRMILYDKYSIKLWASLMLQTALITEN